MPVINSYIYIRRRTTTRLFDMLGSGTEEKGIVQAQNKECGLQKAILDLLSHVCTVRPLGGVSLTEVAP